MDVIDLSKKDSVLNHFLREIRDETIQKEPIHFRKNMERIGEFFAFEISKKLDYRIVETQTPLGSATTSQLSNQMVLASILRAGIPLHHGMLNIFDRAQNAFVSAYRRHHKDGSFDVKVEYVSSPSMDGKVLILSDPMLATGHSMVLAYQELLKKGKPDHIHIVTIVASTQGVEELKKKLNDKNITLGIAALDEELTAQAYIVPGLGDTGDLAYGIKEE